MQMLQVETQPLHLQAAIEGVNVGCCIPVITNQVYARETRVAIALKTGMVLIFALGRDKQVSGDGPVDCVFACRRAQLRNFKMHQDGTRFAVVTDAGDLFVWVEGDRGWQKQIAANGRSGERIKISSDLSPFWRDHECLSFNKRLNGEHAVFSLRSIRPSGDNTVPYWDRV